MAILPAAWSRSVAARKVFDFVTEDDRPAPVEPVAPAPPVVPDVDLPARRLLLLQQ